VAATSQALLDDLKLRTSKVQRPGYVDVTLSLMDINDGMLYYKYNNLVKFLSLVK